MKSRLSTVLMILLIMSTFSGCSEASVENKLPLVKTQLAGKVNINSESVYSGVVKGRYETNLAFQVGDRSQVWVVEDGKTKLRDIEIKDFDGNGVLVNGLKSGEIVVTAGVHKIREGQSVRME